MYIGENSSGYIPAQNSLVLPDPSAQNQYYLFTTYTGYVEETDYFGGVALDYSIIDMNANTGNGAVILKNEPLLQDLQLESGELTAVRHANGRDWWIIWKYYDESIFLRFLLDPSGIHRYEDQEIGEAYPSGVGQAVFSPDGTKYVNFQGIGAEEGKYVSIYEFDRCSGLLRDQILISYVYDGGIGGVAISPDSRYLYVSSGLQIYQFDLWAEDVESSRITIIETADLDDPNLGYYLPQLARDGKIYISGYGLSYALNVINYPDRPGTAATVTTLELPVHNSFSIPNIPYHRLGPLDGSPCDTLGIDNVPLAAFRADQDTSDYLGFYFQDLSAYEPADWAWDFGDGGISQDTSPVHTYAQDGTYEVCLTVSNAYGSDTYCQTLQVGTTAAEGPVTEVNIQAFPNPFQDQFSVVFTDYYPRRATLRCYDAAGRRVHEQRLYHGWNNVDGSGWPAGVYFYEVWEGEERLVQGKVIKG